MSGLTPVGGMGGRAPGEASELPAPAEASPAGRAPAAWAFGPVAVGWVLFVIAYFSPVLLTGRVLAFGDALNQDLPLRVLAFSQLLAGELPFWNPWVFAGQPLLAAIQVGVFFPGNWSFLVLGPAAAMNTAAIAAVALAGLGMLAFARALGLGRAAALVGALVYALSGFMITHLENLQIAQAAALVPALLWAVARLADTNRRRYAVAGAGLVGLQILAGHPQMVVFGGLLVAAYALFRATQRPAGGWRVFLVRAAVVPLAGAGLAALQLGPTLAFIPETQRVAIGWKQLTARSLPPRQLVTLWMPFLFGGHPSPAFPVFYWGVPNHTDLTGYSGIGGFVFGLLALLRGPRRNEAVFFAMAALAALTLALGSYTPVYPLLVAHLPVLGSLPAPGRWLLAVDLCLAVLAALGVHRLLGAPALDAPSSRALGLAWAFGAGPALVGSTLLACFGGLLAARILPWLPPGTGLAAGWASWMPGVWLPGALALALGCLLLGRRAAGPALGPLLVALVACDLAIFGWHVGWRQRAPVAAVLPWPAPLALGPVARVLAVYPDQVYPYDRPAVIAALRLPNWGALGGVRHVGGYDAFVFARYAELLGDLHSGGAMADPAPVSANHHMLDMLAVEQVLLDARLANDAKWQRRLAPPRWILVASEPGALRFRNATALPRAWRVSQVKAVDRAAATAAVTGRAPFAPEALALFDDAAAVPPVVTPGTATLVAESANGLVVSTSGPGPGVVVVSTSYDAGWTARLADDPLAAAALGADVPIARVDGALLGLTVPAGAHRIALAYEPRGWRRGLAISLVTALALLAWLWLGRVARGRQEGLR